MAKDVLISPSKSSDAKISRSSLGGVSSKHGAPAIRGVKAVAPVRRGPQAAAGTFPEFTFNGGFSGYISTSLYKLLGTNVVNRPKLPAKSRRS